MPSQIPPDVIDDVSEQYVHFFGSLIFCSKLLPQDADECTSCLFYD